MSVISVNYYEYRKNIKPGDLISFSDHPSIVSRLIAWRTGSIHTHSAMVIPHVGCFDDRLLIIESLNGGPVPRYLSEKVQNYKGKVWHFPLANATDNQRNLACNWLWDKVFQGIKYDYFGLFTQVIRKVKTDAGHLFCSEAVQMPWECTEIIPFSILAYNPGGLIKFAINEKAISEGKVLKI